MMFSKDLTSVDWLKGIFRRGAVSLMRAILNDIFYA